MEHIITASAVLGGSLTTYKYGKVLVRELSKRLNRFHKPTFRCSLTGLVIAKGGGKTHLKEALKHEEHLAIIDADEILKTEEERPYDEKVAIIKHEIQKLKLAFGKNKRYLVLSSDFKLLKYVGCERRYVAFMSMELYETLKGATPIEELYNLMDSSMRLQTETLKISMKRKFAYKTFQELLETVKLLWG